MHNRSAQSLSSIAGDGAGHLQAGSGGGSSGGGSKGRKRGGMSHLGLQLNSSMHGRQALPMYASHRLYTCVRGQAARGSSSKGRERSGWQALVQIDQWSPIPRRRFITWDPGMAQAPADGRQRQQQGARAQRHVAPRAAADGVDAGGGVCAAKGLSGRASCHLQLVATGRRI